MTTLTEALKQEWAARLTQEKADIDAIIQEILAAQLPSANSGPIQSPSGFPGLTMGDPAVWAQSFVFQDNFPTLTTKFAETYKYWYVYPQGWKDTSGKGTYDPKRITVVDRADGRRVMQQVVDNNGPFGGCVAIPNFGPNGVGYLSSFRLSWLEKVEQDDECHDVVLGWGKNDRDWPKIMGELDHTEHEGSGTYGGWFHVTGATTGGDHQVELKSPVKLGEKFNLITIEHISGKSYRRYIDGVLQNVVLPNGATLSESDKKAVGSTKVLDKGYGIPNVDLRTCFQLESNGKAPKSKYIKHIDYVAIQGLK